ncbi:DUF411 domain-containing protein [Alphaproteobacteria bacterium]|nr:DUF411 domain-containing protein [Alphaproteobacteria bacterium]
MLKKLTMVLSLALSLALAAAPSSFADEAVKMTIYKTPWCGCCGVWTEAMKQAGYEVEVHDMDDVSEIKKQFGVAEPMQACHTARVGGYTVEGHVPLEAITKLLADKPDIAGISVPGMPMGSLGMGYNSAAQYNVYAYKADSADQSNIFYKAGE